MNPSQIIMCRRLSETVVVSGNHRWSLQRSSAIKGGRNWIELSSTCDTRIITLIMKVFSITLLLFASKNTWIHFFHTGYSFVILFKKTLLAFVFFTLQVSLVVWKCISLHLHSAKMEIHLWHFSVNKIMKNFWTCIGINMQAQAKCSC